MSLNANYVTDILDEIALEGLDGITLEALWKRLSVRPNFHFKIDDNTKYFIWKIVTHLHDVKFYELPTGRQPLIYYDYLGQADQQNAMLELDTNYPYSKVKNAPGIFGSCKEYFTRVDITLQVVGMNLQEVQNLWDSKLVIVASQESRNAALLGSFCTPNLDFSKSNVQYEVLERIARARYLGIPTSGKASLQTIVEDCKSVFHYLKFLLQHKLIKKQSLVGSCQANTNSYKVYLTRFYGEHLNECQFILQTAIEELKARPNYLMVSEDFYALFDSDKRNRVLKYSKGAVFRKYISLSKPMPYRTLFPNAKPSDWERKSKSGERIVRCFRLIDPNVEVADIFDKDYEPEDDEISSGLFDNPIFFREMPILSQAYLHIKNSGAKGMGNIDLEVRMGVGKGLIRALIKRLLQEKLCTFYIENDGRRRSKKYIVGENKMNKAAASEIAQILSEKLEASDKAEETKKSTDQESTENNIKVEEKQTAPEQTKTSVQYPQLDEENTSYRTLKRIGMVIKTIKAHRYRLFHQIVKYVSDEELKEGLTTKVDRQTMARMLKKLEKDGLIKILTVTGEDGNVKLSVKIYVEPTFVVDDKLADTLLHTHSSFKGMEPSKGSGSGLSLDAVFSTSLLENLTCMKKMLHNVTYKPDKAILKDTKESDLTYAPKFVRLNMIHDFIFHLVYGYNGKLNCTHEENLEQLSKICAVDDELKKEMPRLYGSQLSSYMFVPPLLPAEGRTPGWLIMSDLLVRMPLSLYVKILRVGGTSPELWQYLHHPVRKHFLIKDLPFSVRQCLFNRKHYFNSFYHDIKRLCFIGLVQFGIKCGKEYYQTFLYLNRKASLSDTTSSPAEYYQLPADMEFPVKYYEFVTRSDVKTYWMDLVNICLATNLGVKAGMIGKEVLSEREITKEPLRKCLKPRSISRAVENDNGSIPGDHLGAAGLDSVMFSFLRSNWIGPAKSKEPQKKKPVVLPFQKVKKEHTKKKKMVMYPRSKLRRNVKRNVTEEHKLIMEPEVRPKKVRKIKKREVTFKRDKKVAYDEVDMEALKLMSTLRVTWSTAEDNLLLICRAAMMYLCPNFRTFVRIPWVEVRRVLQENLPESRNKTQKAIARRIIYMLKNPTTVRSVSLCLEELKQIPEVKERFHCTDLLNNIKPSAPNLPELQNQLYQRFHELVLYMKDRFIEGSSFSVQPTKKDLLPDSLQAFLEKYELETEDSVSGISIKAIREDVIRAILLSSLSCRSDKTSSAVQLFEIYRQYEDDELQNAIRKLHMDKVITIKKKSSNSIFRNGKYLPLTYSPYQLSFAFQHMLNVKYAHEIYSESFGQIKKLLEDDSNAEFEVDLNECNIALFVLGSKGLLSFRGIVPDQIILLDSGDINDDTYSKMLERYCEMLKFSNINSKFVCTSGKIISRLNENREAQSEGNKRSLEEEEPHGSKRIKLEVEEAENSEDSQAGKTAENAENSEVSSDKTTNRSSRIALYMMREEATKEINSDAGRMAQEFFVVNASKVHCSKDVEGIQMYSGKMESKVIAQITKDILGRSLVPLTLVEEELVAEQLRGEHFDEDTVAAMSQVLRFVESKKESGTTNAELRQSCSNSNLSNIVRHLLSSRIVIKSGVDQSRYIAQKYCTPWLLNSFRMTRLEREKIGPSEMSAVELNAAKEGSEEGVSVKKKKKGIVSMEELKSESYTPPAFCTDSNNKVRMIIRPWVRIDGTLNRKVLDRFLGTVLGYIMATPGASMKAVMAKFSPAITPAWTKDLIEILHEIGCVQLTCHVSRRKATLFHKSCVELSDSYTGLEDDECVAVEAQIDAITSLGLFIGNKTYSKDFLAE